MLFPLAWTLPFLAYRRAPAFAVLTVLGVLVIESYVAQSATESITVLPVVMLAFWIAGTVDDEATSVAVGSVAFGLSVVVVAQNPGPFRTADAVFLAIACGAPFVAGTSVRAHDHRARELSRQADDLRRGRESDAKAAIVAERTRIARELHDVVGHAITVMTVQCGAARMLLNDNPAAARDRLLTVERSGREALSEMRRMLEVLRDDAAPDMLRPQPGVDELRQLVADARTSGFDVELRIDGRPDAVSPSVALTAYRIVQEALTNVRKHAGGARTNVCLHYRRDSLEISVENDEPFGIPDQRSASGGHGVVGMRERVGVYGGELVVGPRTGGGYAVRARLPFESEPQ